MKELSIFVDESVGFGVYGSFIQKALKIFFKSNSQKTTVSFIVSPKCISRLLFGNTIC